MDAQQIRGGVLRLYPVFRSLPEAGLARLLAQARPALLPAGTVVFDERSPCQGFPMLLSGAIRVVKAAASGRELQL